jgi:hypothetical protein
MEHFYQNLGEDWFTYQQFYSKMVSYFLDGSHFVEVGSWKGRSAAYMAVEILNSKKNIKFDCVDTWQGSEEHTNPNSSSFNSEIIRNPNWLYEEFSKNIRPVEKIINPKRKNSIDASGDYEDRSLDFVFIDADHTYSSVKQDIACWFPKVKIGGFIAGHDYNSFKVWPGVCQAVDEFLKLPFLAQNEKSFFDDQLVWCLRK